MEMAQGSPQPKALGDGGILDVSGFRALQTRRFGGCRQGGGLGLAHLAAAVESQEVVLQEGVLLLQLPLFGQDLIQAQVKLSLEDRWQLLKELKETAGLGSGSLQIPLQTAQGG